MKVGLSYSRCIRDIVDGKIDIADVLVIIARTDFDPRNDKQWSEIWRGYHSRANMWSLPEWSSYEDEDEARFREITTQIWDMGKLHQPRKFGANPSRLPYFWLDVSVPQEEMENNPAVKQAWDQYQLLAGLATKETIPLDNNW